MFLLLLLYSDTTKEKGGDTYKFEVEKLVNTKKRDSGQNKIISNLDNLVVRSDSATIVNELEIQYLAAKILVLAGKALQEEIGNGANLVVSFAG
ncbi:unnamed protein product [Lactuca virosa]|uniref:Uncharacterized protein n=1 Tax=Lactuca virosa TaxID=75947 RepID=A0AAU9N3Z9_9ASTR|nr:unnamed protein product [Lactuca virosa]